MENRFLNCCFDYTLTGTRSECDRLSCEGNHNPVFNLYYYNINKEWCYCLNRNQLGQYWQCVVQDRDTFCPDRCECMFLLNYETLIFFLQKLLQQIMRSLNLISLSYSVCLQT